VATIDLEAIRHNVAVLKPPGVEAMAVVKANGYGHGAAAVARAALEGGATWLGVALVEEGLALRDAGLAAPILMLTEFPPGSEEEGLRGGLTPTLYTNGGMARLGERAFSVRPSIRPHVKVDTGMHRVGLPPEEAVPFLRRLRVAGLEVDGLWTHLALAEEPDRPFTQTQLARFDRVVAEARAAGFHPRYVHAANSAATMAHPRSHYDMVRLGVAMYGLSPGRDLPGMDELRPAMSWTTAVSTVKRVGAGEAISYGQHYRLDRDSTIATLPVGYADGYRRALSERGTVLIRGRRYPVAGTVTMDQVMVDCGDDPVEEGDEVVLMGRQGDQRVSAEDLASWIGTIPYEVVCGVSERVSRKYVGS